MSGNSSERPAPQFFDPANEIARSSRNLPHWFQPGATTFVTFRADDSMPRAVVEKWRENLRRWLIANGSSPDIAEVKGREHKLPKDLLRAYQRMSAQSWLDELDACHGECVLKQPTVAGIVADTLKYFDGDRYDLDCLVVMPNHVHLLVQIRQGTTLSQQTKSWLRYSARLINEQLGRSGKFWQSEPFDHLIRSPEQFEYVRRYIADNPAKANLQPGEFLYWCSERQAQG